MHLQDKTQKEDIKNHGNKNVGARLCTISVWVDKQEQSCQQEYADISYSVNLIHEWFFQRPFEAELLYSCPYQVVWLKEYTLRVPIPVKRNIVQIQLTELSRCFPSTATESAEKENTKMQDPADYW